MKAESRLLCNCFIGFLSEGVNIIVYTTEKLKLNKLIDECWQHN